MGRRTETVLLRRSGALAGKGGDKKKVGDSFGKRAKDYGTSSDHVAGEDLAFMEAFLENKVIDAALDVSTGAGHTAGLLKKRCGVVFAVDIAFGMLAEAKHRYGGGNISFVCGDSEHLPFARESFSLVTCRIAPHHFHDVGAFLGEAGRVLAKGGFFLLIDSTVPEAPALGGFLNEMEKLRDETHVLSLSVSAWERLINGAGLRIVERRVFRKRHDFLPWLERTGPSRDRKEAVIEMIMAADQPVREYYQFEIRGGEILSYTDDKTLFVCVKE